MCCSWEDKASSTTSRISENYHKFMLPKIDGPDQWETFVEMSPNERSVFQILLDWISLSAHRTQAPAHTKLLNASC